MDAPNFKMSIRDHVPGLRIPFQNRQVGQPLVGGRHSYRAAAVDGSLIHMGNHRLGEGGEGRRCRHLHKGVHPLGYIGDGDGAVRFGLLRSDDLTVTHNVKNSAGEGIAAVVQFNELDLYLGVIFKDKSDVGFAVPDKGLLSFFMVIPRFPVPSG